MRLIDADELKVVSVGRKNGRKFVHADITDAQTIDAIPVDWLKGLMLSTEDDVDKVEFEWIMREWQKEQEDRCETD